MSDTIILAIISIALSVSPAAAGCVGAAIGEGCIGIPTPHEHHYNETNHHHPVIVERHHHRDPVIIERDHHDDDEDE